jgi:hypothetical protein
MNANIFSPASATAPYSIALLFVFALGFAVVLALSAFVLSVPALNAASFSRPPFGITLPNTPALEPWNEEANHTHHAFMHHTAMYSAVTPDLTSSTDAGVGDSASTISASGIPANAVITITEVKTPWYALRFLLKGGFERSLPEYTAIKGLLQKNYAIHQNGAYFGGFYIWQNKADADAWFSPRWYERVEKTYGQAGKVSYFSLRSYTAYRAVPDVKGEYWTVMHRPSQSHTFTNAKSAAQTAGLFRVYAVTDSTGRDLSISLWASREDAERYFAAAKIPSDELTFADTPLLIDKLNDKTSTGVPSATQASATQGK